MQAFRQNICVSPCPKPTKAYRLGGIVRNAGRFGFCGDCLQHALVCRGRLHAAIDTIMAPWDIAALVPCVEEASGCLSSLEGRRQGLVHAGSLLSSANSELHGELLSRLRPD